MNVRKLAVDAIDKVLVNQAFSNIVVNEYLKKFELSEEDKSLFTNLVYGTLQYLITIDYYLEPFITKKKPKHWILNLLYMSVYQLVYLNTPDYAVVNEAVIIARLKDKQLAAFVNGVLRNFTRQPLRDFEEIRCDEIKYLSVKYSHPEWLIAFFLKDYSYEDVVRILEENNIEKNECIRINTLKCSKEELIEKLKNQGIAFSEVPIAPDGLIVYQNVIKTDLFKKGLITMQDISSQAVSVIASPTDNSIVLDLCSAPGGKAAHMAALMHNTGTIFACDIYQHKIKLMNSLFKRLGATNILPQLVDARKVKDEVKESSFDYVLADVPCSGLGVISHKVDLKYRINLESIETIKDLQKEILNTTYRLVKVGGFYIYSTCTINKDENSYQIREFLTNHPNFSIVEEREILPYEYHTDGFYICKMRRDYE